MIDSSGLRAALCAGCLVFGACERDDGPGFVPVSESLLADRFLFVLDDGAPVERFDGSGGSLLTGAGWAPVERWEGTGPVSWIVGRRAEIRFPIEHDGGPLDVVADCHPFHVDGDPQRVRLRVGDHDGDEVVLEPGWQRIRLPLPAEPPPGLAQAWLVFEHARAPARFGQGEDRRKLAAACRLLAIVPRGRAATAELLAGSRLDLDRGELAFAPGTGAALALPPASDARLRLGAVESDCASCVLRIELAVAGRAPEMLFEGPPSDAARLEASFTTPGDRFAKLRFRLLEAEASESPESGVAMVELGDPFVALRRGALRHGPPHAFFYLVDTLRADALEPYGSARPTSPRLREFARDAVVYEQAWATSTWTLPSLASVLTGVLPSRHGAMTGTRKLRAGGPPTVAELLRERGYRTVGISHSYVGGPAFGLDRGFETFFLRDQLNSTEARSQEVRGFLVQWLLAEARASDPLFVLLHTVDPHGPYAPRAPYDRFAIETPGGLPAGSYQPLDFQRAGRATDTDEVAHLRALYEGEVLFADEQFGRFVDLLAHLGLAERALVAFFGDHGEEFGEHGGFEHGRTLYEELLRVPLVVRFPLRVGAGTVGTRRVSLLDLAATTFALSGGRPEGVVLDGAPLAGERSLLARPRAHFAELSVLAGRERGAVDYRALALGGLKCIESRSGTDQFHRPVPAWQTFDLASDAREQAPLDPTSPGARECRRRLLRTARAVRGAATGESDADEEAIEALRALGYLE